jgi:hypothetical protein
MAYAFYLVGWTILHWTSVLFHFTTARAVFKWGMANGGQQRTPLPDIFHRGIPPKRRLRPLLYFPLALAQSTIFLLPGILCLLLAVYHGKFLQAYTLGAALHAPLLSLRALSYRCTLLPDVTQEFKRPGLFTGGTFDLMFSGHVVFALIPTYCMIYFGWCHPLFLLFLALVNLLNAWGIIWFRRHYTVDVWMAWLITTLFFYFSVTYPPYRATWYIST